jgi:two-component system NarL family sensor kinase
MAAASLALIGFAPFAIWAGLASHSRLTDPLTLVLAVAALAANLVEVRLRGKLYVSAAFVCCIMAAALLGPAPAFAVAVFAEIAAWLLVRFSWTGLANNILVTVAPTVTAAFMFRALSSSHADDLGFDGALVLVAVIALVMNAVLAALLFGMRDGSSVGANLRASRSLIPLLSFNVALTVLLAHAYRTIGIEATVFLMVVILVFSYTLRLLMSSRHRAERIEELSTNRGLLVAQALEAEDRARRDLAERLHDHAVQNLLAARQEIEEAQFGDSGGLIRATRAIGETVDELRNAVFDLHPAVLEHAGLGAALRAVADKQAHRGGFTVALAIDPAVEGVADQLVFSLCRELLTNAMKHSQATNVRIAVQRSPTGLRLEVIDDGVGFDHPRRAAALQRGHIGLASMTQRVDALGGNIELDAAPGRGTRIRILLPVTAGLANTSDRSSGNHD